VKRIAHADGQGGLIDTVEYTREEVQHLIRMNELKLASGQATANDVYELATIPGEFIEHWCAVNGIAWADFMSNPSIQTDFINSEFAKPFRVWKGKF
jgi:hypothetical protein